MEDVQFSIDQNASTINQNAHDHLCTAGAMHIQCQSMVAHLQVGSTDSDIRVRSPCTNLQELSFVSPLNRDARNTHQNMDQFSTEDQFGASKNEPCVEAPLAGSSTRS